MAIKKRDRQEVVDKICSLPPDKVAEVEDFVDFLRQRAEEAGASEAAFAKLWDDPNDAEYDRL